MGPALKEKRLKEVTKKYTKESKEITKKINEITKNNTKEIADLSESKREKLKTLESRQQQLNAILDVLQPEQAKSKEYESLRGAMLLNGKNMPEVKEWNDIVTTRAQLLNQLVDSFKDPSNANFDQDINNYTDQKAILDERFDTLKEVSKPININELRFSDTVVDEQGKIVNNDKESKKTPFIDSVVKKHNRALQLENMKQTVEQAIQEMKEALPGKKEKKEAAKIELKEAKKQTQQARKEKESAKKAEIKAIKQAKKMIKKSPIENIDQAKQLIEEAGKTKAEQIANVQVKKSIETLTLSAKEKASKENKEAKAALVSKEKENQQLSSKLKRINQDLGRA